MSTDKGRTWSLLENALKGSNWESMAKELTWGITARSANPDWSDMLELTPKSGTVRKGEMQTVEVSADGSKLVNGTYKFSIKLQNNQSDNNEVKIPVSYSVKGNEPSVVMPKIVDFGSLLVGQTKTMTVEAFNEGYGSFRGSQWGAALYNGNITVSNENFRGPKNGIPSGFPARATTTFDVTFAPTSGGSHTGNVIFTDADGREVRLVVQGSATEPSKLTLDPATVDAGMLNVGDEPSIVKFKVGNAGKYPLEYVFPKFSSETVSGQTAKNHKFGYTVASTLEGYNEFAYDGNPDLIGATAVQFEAPKANFILSLNSPAGIVNPGESVEISATVQANSGMDAGQTFNNLAIITNDPAPEHSAVRINAVIDGAGLVPGVALDSYDLDAGDCQGHRRGR